MKCVGNVKPQGFTLFELSLVLAVLLMLSGLSYPKLAQLYQKHQIVQSVNNLVFQLNFARQLALTEYGFVTVCPSINLINCHADWTKSIIVFIDKNRNGAVDQEDKIASVLAPFNGLKSNRKRLHFTPLFSAANTTATLKVCVQKVGRLWQKSIVLSNMGRVRLVKNKQVKACS